MSDPFSLAGCTILVTGASSGIGRAAALACAARGARLAITGRDPDRLLKTYRDLSGEGHLHAACDLRSGEDRRRILDLFPPLDGIVHSAGVSVLLPFRFYTDAAFDEMDAINYRIPVFLTQEAAKSKKIKEGASIVFIASIGGMIGQRGNGLYAGSKGALVSMARVLALELAPKRIRVNALSPGMVDTPMIKGTGASEEENAEHVKQYPLGLGLPEDIANACVYLLAPASRWVTGSNLVIDGGYTAR